MKNYKIAVAGTGYVGLSIATLLSQHHHVTAVDIIPEKVDMINNRKSPIQDDYIEKYLEEKDLDLTATLDAKAAYSDADFVVIAAPTNYDSHTQHFDTSAVEAVIKLVMEYNPNAIMVIKSTIPVGYAEHYAGVPGRHQGVRRQKGRQTAGLCAGSGWSAEIRCAQVPAGRQLLHRGTPLRHRAEAQDIYFN